MQLQHKGSIAIAAIVGFLADFAGERCGENSNRYRVFLRRTGRTKIELPVTTKPPGVRATEALSQRRWSSGHSHSYLAAGDAICPS
jgi:hypothetical protein